MLRLQLKFKKIRKVKKSLNLNKNNKDNIYLAKKELLSF